MGLSRRDFLKLSGAGTSGLLLLGIAEADKSHAVSGRFPLKKRVGERTTICPYCAVGCSLIMAVENGRITHMEGDPDSPINEGSLCSKGASLLQVTKSPDRLTRPRWRRPGMAQWEEANWDEIMTALASRIQKTRDASFAVQNPEGNIVNRTEAIASLGSVFPNSEEAYLMSKMLRSLGVVYVENEARICVSSAVAADGETVGRGPMSNHWIDLANSDCIMIIGGNMAESFPVAFKWVTQAKDKGAKTIHVDPRFTRTSARSDLYARIRPGTDIAFAGGIIRYILEDMNVHPGNYNLTYVREYTNASFLVQPDFAGPSDTLNGLFSGWKGGGYDKNSWAYQVDPTQPDKIKKDPTLTDSHCVFQLLKKHFARYNEDKVVEITGVDRGTYQEVCRTYAATGQPGKAGAIVFSSSACQRSTGTQTVRSFGILQLLLGNMGMAGGGLNGITGAANGLGCTLQGLVNHWLPGAGSVRPPASKEQSLSAYGANKARMASLLKAWYRDADPRVTYPYLPKRDGDYSWQPLFKAIRDGKIKGLICWGINPMVSGPHSGSIQKDLLKLDWMVVIDLWETETAAFWKPEAGTNPEEIQTEVFLLPAAHSLEKEGSICNCSRWNQWRYAGTEPPGNARSDLWIINKLVLKLKALYAGKAGPNSAAIGQLTWDYGDPPDVQAVTKEMNGFDLKKGSLLNGPASLKDDGTTSCGNWLWCGMFTEMGNQAKNRGTKDPSGIGLFPGWGWAWPVNRRIMYNRASVDLHGAPWDPQHPVINWQDRKWVGDVPDGAWPPVRVSGKYPFIMKPQGRAHLFGPGRPDGPFPEHYEPWESPLSNPLSPQQNNPLLKRWEAVGRGSPAEYPIIATTHRMAEHLHTGAITRRLPWTVEMMPEMFIELSRELAGEKGIKEGDIVTVESARGRIRAKAIVTARLKPFRANGTTVHWVGLPWSWGYMGLSKGDSTNRLTARIGDPNTGIPEFRAFLCNVHRG